jgi:hypothetical protein
MAAKLRYTFKGYSALVGSRFTVNRVFVKAANTHMYRVRYFRDASKVPSSTFDMYYLDLALCHIRISLASQASLYPSTPAKGPK